MDALSIERATRIGNSIGGGVALQLVLMFPKKVEKLVLLASLGLGKEIAIALRLVTLPFLVQLLRPSKRMLAPMLKQNFYDSTLIPDEWIEMRYPVFALPGRKQALITLAQTNFSIFGVRPQVFHPIVAQLSAIAVPTLIV